MNSVRIIRRFDVEGSADRVVLFAWAASSEPRRNNIARVDQHGNVVWRAELPGDATHDCFNTLHRDGDGFVARTFSKWVVRLCAAGQVLSSHHAIGTACT